MVKDMDQFQVQAKKTFKKIANIIHPCLTLSNEAVLMMQHILGFLNQQTVEACRGPKKKGANKQPMELQEVSDAVDTILTTEADGLRKLAKAEALKTVAKFVAGVLVYKPQLAKTKKKGKQLSAPQEFMKSVPTLMNMVDPTARMQKDAREMVADVLAQMCKTLVEKSRANGEENKAETLRPQDVIMAVDQVMGPVMAKHAIAEGARNALLYMNGLSEYKPENFTDEFKKTNQANQGQDKIDEFIEELAEAQ